MTKFFHISAEWPHISLN